jgi:hypothetical protein
MHHNTSDSTTWQKKSPVLVCLEDENGLKWLTLGMEATCSSAKRDF